LVEQNKHLLKNTVRLIPLVLAFFVSHFSGSSQNTTSNPSIFDLRAHYGFVIPHSEAVRNVEDSYPYGLEATYSKMLLSKSDFENCNCFAKLGAGAAFFNYDNPDILGSGLTVYGFVEPTLWATKKFNLGIRAGLGLSYLNNPFDETENPNNQSYSTLLNFFVPVQLLASYPISKTTRFQLGANYNHHSNGGIRVPNKGINFPTISLGLAYAPTPYKITRHQLSQDFTKWKRLDIGIFATQKQLAPSKETKYLVTGLYVNQSVQFKRINAYTYGVMYEYDYHLNQQQEAEGKSNTNPNRLSISGGHEFLFGHYRFSQALALYLYNPTGTDDFFFHRWGLSRTITEHAFVEFYIKAHRHIADHIAIRVGYSLNRKRSS